MKIYLALGGAFIAVATSLYLLYCYNNPIKFQSLMLLDKDSLIHLMKQIRKEFSSNFSSTLRINRKRRRNLNRGGKDYRLLIKDLKDQARKHLQKAIDKVLLKSQVTEVVLSDSAKHFEHDEEVLRMTFKLCSIEIVKPPERLNLKVLEDIFDFYLTKAEKFYQDDPNELNLKMKMLEDEIFDVYKFEPEEIESAVVKFECEVKNQVLAVRELNISLLEKTNEELFF